MIALSSESMAGYQFLNAAYIGINIENILYGIELFLYFKTMRILLRDRGAHKKSTLFYALFSSVMLFLITIWVATEAIFGEKVWIQESDFPGGPYAYWNENISVWYMEWSRVAVIILQLMTDGLMIYRCRMIWNNNRAIVVPTMLWLATLTLGILVAWLNNLPGQDFHAGISAKFTLAYWSASVFLNTTLTCMICYRVVQYGRIVQKCLGREHASLYFAVAMITVESVLPYTLSGIIFLVTLGVDSPTFVAFLCVYVLMMCISPQMLILRVVSGKAWSNDMFTRPGTPIKFNHDSITTSGSQLADNSTTTVHVQTESNMYISDGRGKVEP